MKKNICNDTCPNCIYIGEGDFICDELMEIVIDDWTPVYTNCILEKKGNNNEKMERNNFTQTGK